MYNWRFVSLSDLQQGYSLLQYTNDVTLFELDSIYPYIEIYLDTLTRGLIDKRINYQC